MGGKKSYFFDELARQKEKAERLLIKSKGIIKGYGGGWGEVGQNPVLKAQTCLEKWPKIVYSKV